MKGMYTFGALGVGLVLFVAVNVLSSTTLRSTRLDLTEDNLYTLSEGSKNIVRELPDKVYLDFFFSKKLSESAPGIKTYATRVGELLEEYELLSGGKIELSVYDPEPFSEAEDRAAQSGLRGVPISAAGEQIYFGLVGRNTLDGEEIIPFFDPSTERFLEYALTKRIYTLATPEKKTVGLLSSLPLEGAPPNPMNPMAQPTPPWQIVPQLETYFDVERLDTTVTEIPDSVDVLMLAHAKGLSDETLYAIDQFVLAGGRVMAFVDPNCEADMPPVDPNNPMAAMQADKSSELNRLFSAWGVRMLESKVAADRTRAIRVQSRQTPTGVPFVVWMNLTADEFNDEDPVISQLASVRMAAPGILEPVDGATTEFTPLIATSPDSMGIEQSRIQFFPQPEELLTTFVPGSEALTLAARVSGSVSSAFPDGAPSGEGEDADSGEGHLNESVGPINVVLVADADMLGDQWWIQEMRLGPISLGYQKNADNGDFVFNTIENLAGNDDLISVRAGANFTRPFTRVEELQRLAQEKYLLESQVLQQELQATEAKLAELQRQKGGDSDQLILSDEQRAELDRFREQRIETRKKLREVQHNLNKDIEGLGTTLKLANILGTPLVFTMIVLAVSQARSRRKKN